MRLIYKSMMLIIFITTFIGCLSEEQKKVKLRVEKLDKLVEENKSKLNIFFESLQNFHKIAQVSKLSENLKPGDTAVFNFLSQHFDTLQLISGDIYKNDPKIVFNENSLPVRLNAETPDEVSETQIQNIGWIDKQIVWNIYDRLKNDDWNDPVSNPSDIDSEETRNKTATEYGEMLKKIADCRYLFGVEDIYVKSSTLLDRKTFRAGQLLSKIHIFDLTKKQIIAQYYTLNKNSGLVFVDTTNVNTKQNDLDKDLKQEVYIQLKRRFEK